MTNPELGIAMPLNLGSGAVAALPTPSDGVGKSASDRAFGSVLVAAFGG